MATVLPTDPNWYFSPFNWTSSASGGAMGANNVKAGSTSVRTTHSGAYFRLKVNATSTLGPLTLTLNAARMAGGESFSIWRSTDGGNSVNYTVNSASASPFTFVATLAAGDHDIFVWIEGVTAADRWTTPTAALEIASMDLPAGVTLLAPTLRPSTMLVYGDSTTDAGISTWAHHVGDAMGCEVGTVGFTGQGFNKTTGSTPAFKDSWDKYDSTQSRLVSSLLSPAPKYLLVVQGVNDTDDSTTTGFVTSTLAAIAVAAPTSRMFCVVPFFGQTRAALTAATMPNICRLIDTASPRLLTLKLWFSTDGVHPNNGGAGVIAAALMSKMRDALGSFGSFATKQVGP